MAHQVGEIVRRLYDPDGHGVLISVSSAAYVAATIAHKSAFVRNAILHSNVASTATARETN